MHPYQAFSIAVRLTSCIICSSLTFLVLFQLRHDRKGVLCATLTGITAAAAFTGLAMRVFWIFGGSINEWLTIAGTGTGAVPVMAYIFANEYLGIWTRFRRILARFLIVGECLAILCGLLGILYSDAQITPEGYLLYRTYPWTNVLVGLAALGSLVTWKTLIQQRGKGQNAMNTQVLVGVSIMSCGIFILTIPALNKYVLEQVTNAIGAILIAGPVLRQRLFDPITQLNLQLTRRAEQLNAINRVGRQANSVLHLDALLNGIVAEIQQTFSYYRVTVFMSEKGEKERLVVRASAGARAQEIVASGREQAIVTNQDGFVWKAALTHQIVRSEDVFRDARFRIGTHQEAIHSEVAVPLTVGTTNTAKEILVGVLHIQSDKTNSFSTEDLEVLGILGQQLAIAIRNAELFDEVERQRHLANQANDAKTRFLSAMSHEFRTPLQNIIVRNNFAQNPEEYRGEVKLTDEYMADLKEIGGSAEQLLRLINNVLDLSKIEAGAIDLVMRPYNPLAILKAAQDSMKVLLKPGVEMKAAYATNLPSIYADDLRVKQILINLLSNACKFTEQGTITIDACVHDSHLEFSVADTGLGIPVEARPTLFTRFRQANPEVVRRHGGTGLGLTICKQLVELQGGQIWFDSVEGMGSTFYFTIPLSLSEESMTDAVVGENTAKHTVIFERQVEFTPPVQVLVIDSKGNDWNSLDVALSEQGFKLLACRQTDHAIRVATATVPPLVVMVLQSAGQSAMQELCTQLQDEPRLRHTQIVECKVSSPTEWRKNILAAVQQVMPNSVTSLKA